MAAAVRTRGWAGLELDTSKNGAMSVTSVVAGSPAEAAGFKTGDLLMALNGIKFSDEKSKDSLYALKKTLVPGARVTYTVQRGGVEQRVLVTLAPMPETVRAASVGEHMLEHASSRTAEK
jgi:S1-C subfamily serine protease